MKYKTTNLLRLADTIRQKIQKEKLFNSSQDLLITFSGGQDSVFCFLILDLLRNKKRFTWNCKKVTNFSKQGQTEKELIRRKWVDAKTKLLCTQNIALIDVISTPVEVISTPVEESFSEYKVCTEQEKKNAYDYLNNTFGDKYTLLWCNHFWQKDSFFTMEHVSKLAFCKSYMIHLFAPIEKLLSEQNARSWRHKVTQRSSLFVYQKKDYDKCIGLYYNFVLLTKPMFFISTKSEQIYTTLSSQTSLQNTTHNSTPWPKQLCIQGHNKSDRAEAIFFNLIKGAGINGLSTLQSKQTFLCWCDSNNTFYPILSDFCKEIQILCLNSFLDETFRQKETKGSKAVRLNAFVSKQGFDQPKRFVLQLPDPKPRFGTVTDMNHVKTFYYQLQCKIRKIL